MSSVMTPEVIEQWIKVTSFFHIKRAMSMYSCYDPHILNSHQVTKHENCMCSMCYAGCLLDYNEESVKDSWSIVHQKYSQKKVRSLEEKGCL